ncbi:hypothetical protein [Deinococcus soli (ex Cha et al. 2016)]|uniref:Uncharacterized protein n=2 Tax=Deinococcus soli (ex Cha et al. 2016) TaxID=1309411 RepID=A0ACC6KFW8_9DEIO|nr:hypothetical protein [Deinococcus soli (ex Cha et al. 2016)]MDR6218332.1 hypothetical protein [Deinococcus soli (ex Cha et al. 2016)]MDR6329072.1 hypothetical protein [Deinococcus soli (ex Cha et al. 2016)]MDR6751345.1 hypothetical protein [Deinococcus soli (ex Cha et al. 2016)]
MPLYLPDLPVTGSPAQGQLTVRIHDMPADDLSDRFVQAVRDGRVAQALLFNFEGPGASADQPPPGVTLRTLRLVSTAPYVDYAAMDAVDFDTGRVTPAGPEDRLMAEAIYAYLDVVVAVQDEDWPQVAALLPGSVNLHLAVTLSGA